LLLRSPVLVDAKIYAAAELGEPFLRDRPKATQFPGQLAAVVTQHWRAQTGQPLTMWQRQARRRPSEFAANNVAVYSRDRVCWCRTSAAELLDRPRRS
jgi:hypothetical protein